MNAFVPESSEQVQILWNGQVRGAGLFLGVDVHQDGELARRIVNAPCDQGMLIGVAGLHSHALKIRPQLCFEHRLAE